MKRKRRSGHLRCRLKLEFHGARITSEGDRLAYRELHDALGLTTMAASALAEHRRGKTIRHRLLGLLRQSILRPGDVHSAEGWRSVLGPVLDRYRGRGLALPGQVAPGSPTTLREKLVKMGARHLVFQLAEVAVSSVRGTPVAHRPAARTARCGSLRILAPRREPCAEID